MAEQKIGPREQRTRETARAGGGYSGQEQAHQVEGQGHRQAVHGQGQQAREMSKQVQQIQQHPAGYVGHDSGGHFVHYCHCGKWAAFGYGMRKGHLGQWFCGDHRQEGPVPVIVTLSEVWRNRAIEAGKARTRQLSPETRNHTAAASLTALTFISMARWRRWRSPSISVCHGRSARSAALTLAARSRCAADQSPDPAPDIRIRPHDRDDLPYVLAHVRRRQHHQADRLALRA